MLPRLFRSALPSFLKNNSKISSDIPTGFFLVDDLPMVFCRPFGAMDFAANLGRRGQPDSSARLAGYLSGRNHHQCPGFPRTNTAGENVDASRHRCWANADVGTADSFDGRKN